MPIGRIESGIPGLDKIIEGGFVPNSVNLVAGQTGAGKTLFCMQYLLHGLRKGEPGLYITLEQKEDEIMQDVSRFGWDVEFQKYIKTGKFMILSLEPTGLKELTSSTVNYIKKVGAKRFVLDSLSIATMGWKVGELDITKIRSEVFNYIKSLKSLGVVSLLITEIPETDIKALSRFGFEEFLADAIIKLYYLGIGEATYHNLEVRKMRRTDHGKGSFPMEFTKAGLKISTEKRKLHF